MSQRYSHPQALRNMGNGLCPECGESPDRHIDDIRFWIPRKCDLLPRGVEERISQYAADLISAASR